MFKDEGVRNHNQMQGVDSNGNLRNIKVDENGNLMTVMAENGEDEKIVKTIACDVLTAGTTETSIELNKYVSKIEIANYSDTAKLSVVIGSKTFTIGANIVLDIIVDDTIESISITSTEDDTTVQYLIEGVE